MAAISEQTKYLLELDGMHEYKGRLYLPFMPPGLLEQVQEFETRPGDIIFGTFPRSGRPMVCNSCQNNNITVK